MHFNFAYGDVIRDAVLGQSRNASQQEHSHVELNQDNLNQYISDVDTNLQGFRQSHSEIISLFYEKANVAK